LNSEVEEVWLQRHKNGKHDNHHINASEKIGVGEEPEQRLQTKATTINHQMSNEACRH
jgi:hypothetical protein